MLQTIWHYFSFQFSLLFQMLCSILLTVLPFFRTPTDDWWKTFNSQSGSTKRMVLKCTANHLKTELKRDVRLFVAFCLTYFIVWQVVPYEGFKVMAITWKSITIYLWWFPCMSYAMLIFSKTLVGKCARRLQTRPCHSTNPIPFFNAFSIFPNIFFRF